MANGVQSLALDSTALKKEKLILSAIELPNVSLAEKGVYNGKS
jgi:hypothetical protein